MFNCTVCSRDKKIKKINGCVSPLSVRMCKKYHGTDYLWLTDKCFLCGGTNPKCPECKGSNYSRVFRCPRALARSVNPLLPYFFDWVKSNRVMWPNGGCRLDQPLALSQAFDLLDSLITSYQEEKADKNARKNKSRI